MAMSTQECALMDQAVESWGGRVGGLEPWCLYRNAGTAAYAVETRDGRRWVLFDTLLGATLCADLGELEDAFVRVAQIYQRKALAASAQLIAAREKGVFNGDK